MTVLGEAFIEVRGDLKPFIRDLDKQLKAATEKFERSLKASVSQSLGDSGTSDGERLGDRIGDGVDAGMRRRLGDKTKSPYTQITAALASALDDGISALPAEAKAAIVTGILVALPLISGALAGAVSAAIGAGVAGIGTLLAFQFESVRIRGESFATLLRERLVIAASAFAPAVLSGMDQIEARVEQLLPTLNRIFAKAAGFVEPLIGGTLDFVENLLSGVDEASDDISGFVQEFSAGMRTLGKALRETIKILAGTGESGREAFRDLIFLISVLLVNTAKMIAFFTEVYHWVRKISDALFILTGITAIFTLMSDRAAAGNETFISTNLNLAESMEEVTARTEAELKRMKDLSNALDDASKATYGIIQSQIDFEESLDRITEALDENGRTLDITKEKGRENVEAFLAGLEAAEKETLNNIATGKMSAQQAAQYYDQQIAKVQELARNAGITGAQFDLLFGDIISVAQLKLDAAAMGLINTQDELSDATKRARELLEQLQRIRSFRLPAQGTRGFSEYAEGGIVTHPTRAIVGEAGAEVIIPLTKPQRAAQLAQQSGLAKMLGGGSSVINVYVGNEQLDARTYRIVEGNNMALSSSLAYGARGL